MPLPLGHLTGGAVARSWGLYLPAMVFAYIVMVPFIIIAEKRRKIRPILPGAVGVRGLTNASYFHANPSEVAKPLTYGASLRILMSSRPVGHRLLPKSPRLIRGTRPCASAPPASFSEFSRVAPSAEHCTGCGHQWRHPRQRRFCPHLAGSGSWYERAPLSRKLRSAACETTPGIQQDATGLPWRKSRGLSMRQWLLMRVWPTAH